MDAGTLVRITLPPGRSKHDDVMCWMADKYGGSIGVVVDMFYTETYNNWADRVPVLISGAIRPFSRSHLVPL